jgi:uncharacterized protein YbjT (DUF2867 family)
MNADVEPGYALGRLHRQEETIIERSRISYTFLSPTSFMQNFKLFWSDNKKPKCILHTFWKCKC